MLEFLMNHVKDGIEFCEKFNTSGEYKSIALYLEGKEKAYKEVLEILEIIEKSEVWKKCEKESV